MPKLCLFKSSYATTVLRLSMLTGASLLAMSTQAAGLGELFAHSDGSASSTFLPVDKAFQVNPSTSVTANGTRLSIGFDITPGHYVYKNQLNLRFPKGISATPLQFSQTPVSLSDPTFGQVPVFTQKRVVATTILTSSQGKAAKNVPVIIEWQGCAKAGLCYPPEKIKTKIDIARPQR